MLTSPLFWVSLVLIPFYAYALLDQYFMLSPDTTYEDGTVALGLNPDALRFSAFWAVWTALAYVVLFIWLDRFRPQRPLVWLLAFGWGAAASTWISIYVNSWAAEAMATTSANADSGTRPAIFIAPFSEEASKATVLFLLIILWRTKVVSRLSIVTMAGLSAVGFAFVENIVYYARAVVYVTNTPGIADPYGEVMQLVMLRGVWTSFGHPMFTIMTATGLAVALGARSRIVRIMAPLAGFLAAAGGHMLFNGVVSTTSPDNLRRQWIMAIVLVATVVISLVLTVVGQAQLIRQRLTDYVRVGWLRERDTIVFSGPFKRMKLHLAGIFRGPRKWWATAKFMRRITELAYLRSQMTRGTVAEGGDDRAHEIIHELEELRPKALTDTAGLRMFPPRKAKRTAIAPAPVAPGPAGLGGNWAAR
ncbi:MAG: PrsW family intramembrane metalloprotease [Arachnia sp.]